MSSVVCSDDEEDTPSSFIELQVSCNKCQPLECRFLHDNVALDCPEAQTCDICPKLAEVDAQISRVQEQLAELARNRHALKMKVNTRHARPVHRLSAEVLSLIFTEVITDMETGYWRRFKHPLSRKYFGWFLPLLLGGVCMKWRVVTCSMPRLWTPINIKIRRAPRTQQDVEMTKQWLGRSCQLPLRLSITGDGSGPDCINGLLLNWNAVLLHSSRWGHLSFSNMSAKHCESLLRTLKNIPEGLETFRIDLLDEFHKSKPGMLPRPLRPKEFYSSNEFSIKAIPVEWNGLTDLNVSSICMDELLHIIVNAPHLTKCVANEMEQSQGRFPMPEKNKPVLRSSLKHMEIKICPVNSDIFQYLTCPSLEFLEYKSVRETPKSTRQNLVDFLRRSSVSSRPSFKFFFSLDLDYYGEFNFEGLHSITRLRLHAPPFGPRDDDPLEEALMVFSQDTPFILPHLEELEIEASVVGYTNWCRITDLFRDAPRGVNSTEFWVSSLSKKQQPGTSKSSRKRPLRRIVVSDKRDPEEDMNDMEYLEDDIVDRLHAIRDSGVSVDVLDVNGESVLDVVDSPLV